MHTVYHRSISDPFCGAGNRYVIVADTTGHVIADLQCWHDPSVASQWDPRHDGFAGQQWATARPPGWRKVPPEVFDWAMNVLAELED